METTGMPEYRYACTMYYITALLYSMGRIEEKQNMIRLQDYVRIKLGKSR